MIETTKLQRFVELSNKKKDMDDNVEEIKAEMAMLECDLLDQMGDSGISQLKCDGVTVYIHSQLWASPIDKPAVCQALIDEGYEELVSTDPNVNSSKLSSFIREFPRTDDGLPELPDYLNGIVKVTDKVQLKTRRS